MKTMETRKNPLGDLNQNEKEEEENLFGQERELEEQEEQDLRATAWLFILIGLLLAALFL
jgi:hypothetical protein